MNNFIYHNPTKLVFGKGQIARLPKLIPAGKRIMLTFGGGSVKRNGVYDQVVAALEGRDLVAFESLRKDEADVASHAHLSNESQTVPVAIAVGTQAADAADGDVAEFGFDVEAARMHLAHDGGGDGDVRFARFGGGVDHHALESGVGALPALFDRGGVVEVERHRPFDLRGGEAGGGHAVPAAGENDGMGQCAALGGPAQAAGQCAVFRQKLPHGPPSLRWPL